MLPLHWAFLAILAPRGWQAGAAVENDERSLYTENQGPVKVCSPAACKLAQLEVLISFLLAYDTTSAFMSGANMHRRRGLLAAAATSLASTSTRPVFSATASSLKAQLDSQDSSLLLKPLNKGLLVPAEAEYPSWLEGEWSATQSFAGYELPSKDLIARDALFSEGDVPGFKKCSIALLPDVGKEGVTMTLRWLRDGNGILREDRVNNFRSAVRGGLGYDAIERIDYKVDPNNRFGLGSLAGNPNRLKLVFTPGLTTNANRIELFVNARETEQPSGRDDLFYTSEEIRQVTYSGTVSRQVNGEYCHFISYRRISPKQVDMVIVTAAYADPLQLERLYVKIGDRRPLIVFSHALRLMKKDVQ